jgi:hypothetical protein
MQTDKWYMTQIIVDYEASDTHISYKQNIVTC